MCTEFDLYEELFNGTIGNIIEMKDEGSHSMVVGDISTFDGDFYKNGQKLVVDDGICSIEEFDFDENEVWLLFEDGYRGEGCYYGLIDRGDQNIYLLDIVNEGTVFNLVEEK